VSIDTLLDYRIEYTIPSHYCVTIILIEYVSSFLIMTCARALKNAVIALLAGETMPRVLMTVIR
jgi:hypothetical protein